jgi:hypothetical protein
MPERLFDQIEGVDQHADAREPPRLELHEMGEPLIGLLESVAVRE